MEKYTAKDIVEKRISFKGLTENQFYKLRNHFQNQYPDKQYSNFGYFPCDNSWRFYPVLNFPKDTIYSICGSYLGMNNSEVNSTKEITYDEFDFETNENSETQFATREQIRTLHDVACSKWQEHLKIKVNKYPFDNKIPFDDSEIEQLFNACTTYNGVNQVEVLETVFRRPEKDNNALIKDLSASDIKEISKKLCGETGIIQLLGASTPDDREDLRHRALALRSDYKVNLHNHSNGVTIIEIVKKT